MKNYAFLNQIFDPEKYTSDYIRTDPVKDYLFIYFKFKPPQNIKTTQKLHWYYAEWGKSTLTVRSQKLLHTFQLYTLLHSYKIIYISHW